MNLRHVLQIVPVLATSWVLLASNPAQALTITNRDTAEVAITVSESAGTPAVNLTVKPGETVDNICATGCEISLANGATDSFQGDEVVLIEDGQLTVSE